VYANNVNVCSLCNPKYYLTPTGCALQNIANCQTYLINLNTCSICASGYFLQNNVCVAQNIPDCSVYEANQNVCKTCREGFYLFDGLCPAQFVAQCQVYELGVNACKTCNQYYRLLNGQCILIAVAGCRFYQGSTNFCVTCLPGYRLDSVNNVCILQPIENCSNQNDQGCLVCDINFYTNGFSCLPQFIDNCITYVTNYNICTFCFPGYYLSNGLCAPQYSPFCIDFEPNSNVCIGCEANYIVQNGGCVLSGGQTNCQFIANGLCVTCIPGYYVNATGFCQAQSLPNCNAYVPNKNECDQCVDGFILMNGMCAVGTAIPGCKVYSSLTACDLCQLNFYLSGSICLPQSLENCITYVVNKNECSLCFAGFLIDQSGICLANSLNNCDILINTEVCYRCSAGYYQVGGACFPASSGDGSFCVKYTDATKSACAVCDINFYLANGRCLAQGLPNCIAYFTNVNECSFCYDGFYPNTIGFCTPQKVQDCLSYAPNSNSCLECNTGFTLVNNLCLSNNLENWPANALVYNGGNVIACRFGFVVSADRQSCVAPSGFSLNLTMNGVSVFLSANMTLNPAQLYLASDPANKVNSMWSLIATNNNQNFIILTSDLQYVLTLNQQKLVLKTVNDAFNDSFLWAAEFVSSNQFYLKNVGENVYINRLSGQATIVDASTEPMPITFAV